MFGARSVRSFIGHSRQLGAVRLASSFKVLGIQQVAIGGLDKQALSSFWVDTLGVKKVGDYKAEKENVDEDILELGSGPHAVEIDLMQPLNPDVAPKVSDLSALFTHACGDSLHTISSAFAFRHVILLIGAHPRTKSYRPLDRQPRGVCRRIGREGY